MQLGFILAHTYTTDKVILVQVYILFSENTTLSSLMGGRHFFAERYPEEKERGRIGKTDRGRKHGRSYGKTLARVERRGAQRHERVAAEPSESHVSRNRASGAGTVEPVGGPNAARCGAGKFPTRLEAGIGRSSALSGV